MTKFRFALYFVGLYGCLIALTNCAILKKGAKGALDIADALCIVAHADLDDEAAILACNIIRDYKDDAKKLLSETRKASAKAAAAKASACMPSDAGVSDAGAKDAAK